MSDEHPAEKILSDEERLEVAKRKWFTPAERAAIIASFDKLSKNPKCDICGEESWALCSAPVSPVVVDIDRDLHVPSINLGFSYPSAMFNCENCGNSKILQLKRLGVDVFGKAEE